MQEFAMKTMCLSYRDEFRKTYRRPSMDAPCKTLPYLATRFQGRRFLEIHQSEKKMLSHSDKRPSKNENAYFVSLDTEIYHEN